jgi:hypothetical protein
VTTAAASPGESFRRPWTGAEEKRLRELYPRGDAATMLEAFPGRTTCALYARACKIGLGVAGGRGGARRKRRHAWTPHEDEALRRAYAEGRGAVRRLCASLAVSYPTAQRRAGVLGIDVPRLRPADWADQEDAILRESAHLGVPALRRRLASAGFPRTAPAIYRRRAELGIRALAREAAAEHKGVVLMPQVATMFGVSHHTVMAWVKRGWLSARRPDGCDYQTGAKAIREFVATHAAHIDLRKVEAGGDKFVLLDLLLQRAGE